MAMESESPSPRSAHIGRFGIGLKSCLSVADGHVFVAKRDESEDDRNDAAIKDLYARHAQRIDPANPVCPYGDGGDRTRTGVQKPSSYLAFSCGHTFVLDARDAADCLTWELTEAQRIVAQQLRPRKAGSSGPIERKKNRR
ncbi:hypothetical protein [Sphaerisporangium album]|uniref:hypothetical protein n=1 Tax=Sphaerisporangium album TaxID=509200 RepID=UPI001C68AE1D|nr:hypothetical protein [Sphaerisporangium album]